MPDSDFLLIYLENILADDIMYNVFKLFAAEAYMNREEGVWAGRRKRISEVIEVGSSGDWISRGYDIFSTLMLLINLTATVASTFDSVVNRGEALLVLCESVTVAFFAIDYILRVWTARFVRPGISEGKAIFRYVFSFTGIVDLLCFLPHYLPFFIPSGAAFFRMFRVIRIFRLFQINAYYDSLNVITQVIASKKQQLVSSVFIIFVLMFASSLCMYSLEHEAQPDVFVNAFSGIWWSVSTLLTVGYGDIYPVTTMGQLFGIVISFLGVGMVAIPTGIISAGFVEQYSRIKRMSEYASEDDIQFIKLSLKDGDKWTDKSISQLMLPSGLLPAMIRRGKENLLPQPDTLLKAGDVLILSAEAHKDDKHIELKELVLMRHHPWNGLQIQELDISRQTVVLMIKRGDTTLQPKADLVLEEKDRVILFSQERIADSDLIHI